MNAKRQSNRMSLASVVSLFFLFFLFSVSVIAQLTKTREGREEARKRQRDGIVFSAQSVFDFPFGVVFCVF